MDLASFDLDGVIVDTEQAVREAYKIAGVDMPEDAWGRGAGNWLEEAAGSPERAAAAHLMKQEVYPRMLEEHCKLLAGHVLVHELLGAGHEVIVVTLASLRSAKDALAVVQLADKVQVYSTTDKNTVLHSVRPAFHVDDRPFRSEVPIIAFENDIQIMQEKIREVLEPSTVSSSPRVTVAG